MYTVEPHIYNHPWTSASGHNCEVVLFLKVCTVQNSMAHPQVILWTQDAHKVIKLCKIAPLHLFYYYSIRMIKFFSQVYHLCLLMGFISEPNVHRIQQYPQISGLNCEVLTSRGRNVTFILKLISMSSIGEIPDCNKVVLILRWSYFRGGLIARFYCIILYTYYKIFKTQYVSNNIFSAKRILS